MKEAADLSLADFYFLESDDPLVPSREYTQWRKDGAWATGLYHPALEGPAVPRVRIQRAGSQHQVINLTSYNYMGFVFDPEVKAAARAALERYGTGACGSPLLSGYGILHLELQERLSRFMQREDTILFNSGFGGAMGGLAGLLRKGDVAVMDEKCHLSLIAGGTLSRSKVLFFKHNDPESLEEILKTTGNKRRVVVVEGIYSMDGDFADLPALLEVAERHRVGIYIDEAHSILAWGKSGRGALEHFGVEKRVPVVFGTFSKSFAGLGGFISAAASTVDYLRYYSNPYGFSCALPPATVAGLIQVLKITERENAVEAGSGPALPRVAWDRSTAGRDGLAARLGGRTRQIFRRVEEPLERALSGKTRRQRLHDNSEYFHQQLVGLGLNLGESTTQVIPIMVGSDRRKLYEMCHEMNEKGLFLQPVDYPSVPEDGLRFRCAVTAAHTRRDLDEALQILEDTVVKRMR